MTITVTKKNCKRKKEDYCSAIIATSYGATFIKLYIDGMDSVTLGEKDIEIIERKIIEFKKKKELFEKI